MTTKQEPIKLETIATGAAAVDVYSLVANVKMRIDSYFILSFIVCFCRVATKPVFGVSDKVIFKLACSATEKSYNIEILLVECLDIILSVKRTTKALIRLCVLLANH